VRSFVRIRPALSREIDGSNKLSRCVAQQPNTPVVHVATKPGAPVVVESDGSTKSEDVRTFELDGVFDETCETEAVYAAAGHPAVDGVLDGVNSTIMCYGMTGSGKTHTMLGEPGQAGGGIVGLAARSLLEAAEASNGSLTIEAGFMQLYGTTATDLLVANSPPLKIARIAGEVVVEGQCRRCVTTPDDVAALIAEGVSRRKVTSQKLNSASSRSHAVLTFYVASTSDGRERESGDEDNVGGVDDETVAVRCAKLLCVDLAGSERVKESGVEGMALKEAQAINLSLFHLVRVVQALNERATATEKPRLSHKSNGAAVSIRVPYADSPLTLLLSDALGGNSRTAIVATLSPAQQASLVWRLTIAAPIPRTSLNLSFHLLSSPSLLSCSPPPHLLSFSPPPLSFLSLLFLSLLPLSLLPLSSPSILSFSRLPLSHTLSSTPLFSLSLSSLPSHSSPLLVSHACAARQPDAGHLQLRRSLPPLAQR